MKIMSQELYKCVADQPCDVGKNGCNAANEVMTASSVLIVPDPCRGQVFTHLSNNEAISFCRNDNESSASRASSSPFTPPKTTSICWNPGS